MKKIFKSLIYIAILSIFVISCDEDETTFDPLNFPADAFVSVEGSSVAVLESSTNPIEIIVNYSNSTEGFTSEISVDFSITSSNGIEGTHYTIEDNKTQLTFPVGVFSDKIVIIPIDNLMEDGNKVLNFTLDNAPVTLGFPGPDGLGKSLSVTLTDDDCAFTFADLDGISWSGTDNSSGDEGPNATQIVTSFDGTNLLMDGIAFGWLTNTAFWDEVVVESEPVIVVMDPVTGAFTIDQQFLANTTWLGDPQPTYSISATGQYFSCLHSMVVNYTLYQSGGIRRQYTENINF